MAATKIIGIVPAESYVVIDHEDHPQDGLGAIVIKSTGSVSGIAGGGAVQVIFEPGGSAPVWVSRYTRVRVIF